MAKAKKADSGRFVKRIRDDLWAVEDAAAEIGVSRQWLNTLLRNERYDCVVVPNRQDEDAPPRMRLLSTVVVEKIAADREVTRETQEELRAEARRVALERKKRGPGRPRKPRISEI